jgi:hypothetical protein
VSGRLDLLLLIWLLFAMAMFGAVVVGVPLTYWKDVKFVDLQKTSSKFHSDILKM